MLIDNLFLGAGAMKAGTTWLYSVLDKHPEIYFSFEKEIHYFYALHVKPQILSERARLRNAETKYLKIDPERARPEGVRNRLHWVANYLDGPVDDFWYRNLFAQRGARQTYAADFSNLYALLPEVAWTRILTQTERLRVLYTLRDPAKRLWSHVKFHLKMTGREDELSHWSGADFGRFVRQPFIWENAEYGHALRRMRNAIPADCLKIAWHERVHADEVAFLRDVEGFLGIAPHSYPESLLSRKVNTTPARPIPPEFIDAVRDDLYRIIGEVEDQGLTPPESWRATLDPSLGAAA